MLTAFLNLKGGCGKSTSAVHLCRYLLGQNRTVALVDADSQATSSTWVNALVPGIPRPDIHRITEPDPLLDTIPALSKQYQEVVIDGAGGLAEVQRAILLLAEIVLIPVQPSAPDISASQQAIQSVRRARQIRQGSPQAFTFLTRVTPNTLLLNEAREVLDAIEDVPRLKGEINQRQAGADVMGQGSTLFDMSGRGAAELARQYRDLFREVGYGRKS